MNKAVLAATETQLLDSHWFSYKAANAAFIEVFDPSFL